MTAARQQLGLFDMPEPARAQAAAVLDQPAPLPAPVAPAAPPAEAPEPEHEDPAVIVAAIQADLAEAGREMGELQVMLAPSDAAERFQATMARHRAEQDRQLAEVMEATASLLGLTVPELQVRLAQVRAEEIARKADRKSARAAPKTPSGGDQQTASQAPAPAGKRSRSAAVHKGGGDQPAEAAPPTRRLTDRQRQLLAGFEAGPDNVVRYSGADHVPDWVEAKLVLELLGGTWRRAKPKGGFHFPDDLDAAELLRLALAAGEVLDPKLAGFFETPVHLADRIAALGELTPGCRVLEPSAGKGRIALAARRACPGALISCVELMPANRAALEAEGFELIGKDFLALEARAEFDAVLMNPTFNKRGDIHHTRHAWGWLRAGGRLVAVTSAGVEFREDELAREFRAWVEQHGGRIERLPEGTFRESGTDVGTCLVTVRKGER
jgi:hypothetical protein